MPSAKAKSKASPSPRPIPPAPPASTPETVDPVWLLKAGAAVVAVGLLCAYVALCVLFYNEQWQLVLHPSRTVAETPAAVGLAFQPVRFGDDAAGQPQLAGWWIPSDLPTDPTVLVLHGQDGSMTDALKAAQSLHKARLNALLFDYRGYGQSAGRHPTEQEMRADAQTALHFLIENRRISQSSVLVYGSHLGASLAVRLCEENAQIPGIILESADGDTETRVLADVRSHIMPVRLLFHERFPLADPLARLRTPKLLISYTQGNAPVDVQRAADPKMTAELPPNAPPEAITAEIRRFLDTYVQHPAAKL